MLLKQKSSSTNKWIGGSHTNRVECETVYSAPLLPRMQLSSGSNRLHKCVISIVHSWALWQGKKTVSNSFAGDRLGIGIELLFKGIKDKMNLVTYSETWSVVASEVRCVLLTLRIREVILPQFLIGLFVLIELLNMMYHLMIKHIWMMIHRNWILSLKAEALFEHMRLTVLKVWFFFLLLR